MTNCTKHFTKVHIKVFKNFPELEYIAFLKAIKLRQTLVISDTKMSLKNNLSEISSSSQRHIF